MPSGGIRTHNLSGRAAEDLRLRLRGHWDQITFVLYYIVVSFQFWRKALWRWRTWCQSM